MKDERTAFLSALLTDLAPPPRELAALVRQAGPAFPATPFSPRWLSLRDGQADATHLSVAAFDTESQWSDEGEFDFRRVEARVSRVLLWLADDVNHKATSTGAHASAVLETRAPGESHPNGSRQEIFRIRGGCTPSAWRVLAELWSAIGLTDDKGQNPIRLLRLPGSQPPNKERARLVSLSGRAWTWADLVALAGGDVAHATAQARAMESGEHTGVGSTDRDMISSGDRFFRWLLQKGMVIRPSGIGDWWKVTCPWGHDHSDGDPDTGARYKPDFSGKPGGFVCDRGGGHATKEDFDRWIVSHMLEGRGLAKTPPRD